ncbi:MAG: hypothetical protein EOP83_08705, partial [Verrucomicrobiaceae bacterium]
MTQHRPDRRKMLRAQRELTLRLHQSKTQKTKMEYFLGRWTRKFPGCINARLRMPRRNTHIWLGDVRAGELDYINSIIQWLEARKMYMLVHLREDHEIN